VVFYVGGPSWTEKCIFSSSNLNLTVVAPSVLQQAYDLAVSVVPFPTSVSPVVSPLNRHDASDSSGGVRSRLRVSSGNDDSAMDIVQGAGAIGSETNAAMAMTSTISYSLDHAVPPSTVILPPAPAPPRLSNRVAVPSRTAVEQQQNNAFTAYQQEINRLSAERRAAARVVEETTRRHQNLMEELLEHKPLDVSEGDPQTLLEQQAGVQSFASKFFAYQRSLTLLPCASCGELWVNEEKDVQQIHKCVPCTMDKSRLDMFRNREATTPLLVREAVKFAEAFLTGVQ